MAAPAKILPAAAIAAALVLTGASASRAQPTDPHAGHAPAMTSVAQTAELTATARAAVEEALQDELRGEAIYARVLKDHGDVRPFSNVVRAERRHVAFLEDLLKARSLAVPARPTTAPPPGYASVREACAAAVEFETKNVALYDRLLAAGPVPDDVKRAFDHNRVASLDRHKPAFERCAGLASGQEAGRGAGWHAHRAAGHGMGQGPGRGCAGHGRGHGCGHRSGRGCGHDALSP